MSLLNYIQETKSELKHVSWPTKYQSVLFTILVVVLSIATALFLSFFDYVFSMLLKYFIG